mgnify:CR=1 FL=1
MKPARWIPLLPFSLLLILSEWAVKSNWIPRYLLPAPTEVLNVFFQESDELWRAALATGLSAFAGFTGSVLLGISLGVIFSSSRWIERAFYPYAIFFQTVPIIAIAPLLVIWFGYGTPTIVMTTLIVAIFPMVASTLDGLRSTDPALLDLFKLQHASRFQTLFKLKLPFALPQIFVGLKISAGLAVIGAIVGEFITGGGLGGIIDIARTRQRVDQVFAAILLASAIGLLFMTIVQRLARVTLRHWHPSENYEKKYS